MSPASPIIKVCSCGRHFTLTEWRNLPYVGRMPLDDNEHIELRNCHCQSTIATKEGDVK